MAAWSNTPGGVPSTTWTSRVSPLVSTVYSTVRLPAMRCATAVAGYSGAGARRRFRLAASAAGSSPLDFGAASCCTASTSFGSAPQRIGSATSASPDLPASGAARAPGALQKIARELTAHISQGRIARIARLPLPEVPGGTLLRRIRQPAVTQRHARQLQRPLGFRLGGFLPCTEQFALERRDVGCLHP